MRRLPAAACVILGLWGAGCASALHEHPQVVATGAPERGGSSVATLLGRACAAWARRPDVDEVRRARRLFLEVARKDGGRDVVGLLGAADATAWLVEHVNDPAERRRLAGEAVDLGQLCLQRAPGDARCRYHLALALGLQARERPSTGLDGVRRMTQLLRGLTRDAPGLDGAGPERVLALVLLRAPGWPAGPGDPEEGLEAARRAVELAPGDARNQTVLAEALVTNGQPAAARRALERARVLAAAARASGNPDARDELAAIERAEARLRGQ